MGNCSAGSGSAGYSAKGASVGMESMYSAPITGIEAELTTTPLTANGVDYQPLSQQLYQPLTGSTEPYLPGSSPEGYLAGTAEQYLACPQCGSDVPYGSGSEMSPMAMSALAEVMQQGMQEVVRNFYKKACPACMTGKGMHTCGH